MSKFKVGDKIKCTGGSLFAGSDGRLDTIQAFAHETFVVTHVFHLAGFVDGQVRAKFSSNAVNIPSSSCVLVESGDSDKKQAVLDEIKTLKEQVKVLEDKANKL